NMMISYQELVRTFPSILFMDEATSHLDLNNESIINQSISSLSITRIIVAHRPSTIASADRVIDLSQSKTLAKV
ncbi:TPA: hypothetical protein MYV99_005067, partial [Klebsiella pneumoniae]|nr:hypothetical protein [Klebsiella pneumoniae]